MPNYSKNIVYLSQAQYQELITNGTITVDGVTVTYNENDIYVTPQAEPVTDVRVNGTSIAANGVANIPIGGENRLGVVKRGGTGYSVNIESDGTLKVVGADTLTIKQANSNSSRPVTPSVTHVAAFYGLAKASGDTTQAASDNAVGSYTDAAKGSIQQMLGVSSLIAPSEPTLIASKAYAVGDVFTANGKLYKVTTAIAAAETIVVQNEGETVSGHNAEEVQIEGTFVKNTDIATDSTAGVVKISANGTYGIELGTIGDVRVRSASASAIKSGGSTFLPITPGRQQDSVFYGLATAAGDTTQKSSSNAVGTYTDNAKASIKSMLGIVDGSTGTVTVSGTTPTITAVENTRYVCGEVATLTITPPASGICIIRFTSGTTATVLTATGVVWPEWFDATALEASRVYEICITDGYGAVMSWAL